MRHRQVLEKFLGALVGVEQSQLQIKHGLARDAKEKMAWLDDARGHWTDRHLEGAILLPDVIGEQAHKSRIPLAVQVRAKAGEQVHWGMKIDFVRMRHPHGFESLAEALCDLVQNGFKRRKQFHCAPSTMWAACW